MALISVGNGTGSTHANHLRAVKIRAVRQQLKLGPPPMDRFGSDPIKAGKGQKAIPQAVKVTPVDTKRAAPKASPPLSFSDRLNYRTGRTTPDDQVARVDMAAGERGLRAKGRSLHAQEQTIERLRQYGILRRPEQQPRLGGDFARGARSSGGGDFGNGGGPLGAIDAVPGVALAGKGLSALGDYISKGSGPVAGALESGASDLVNFAAAHLNLGKSPFGAVAGDKQTTGVQAMKNIGKDALDIPIQTVPALYQIGSAGVSAATGNTKPAKQLAGSIVNSTALGRLVQGDVKGAEQIAKQHPLDTALTLSGARAVLGRGAGAALRSGALGERAAQVASTARPDLKLLGNIHETRHYSPDLTVKGAQKLGEAFQRSRGKDPNVATGARAVRKLRRRMRETAGANEIMRREGRDAMAATMHQLEPGSRYMGQHADTSTLQSIGQRVTHGVRIKRGDHTDITGLIGQKIVRSPATMVSDLKAYRRVVADNLAKAKGVKDPTQPHYMHAYEQRAGQGMLDSIDKALADKQFIAHPQEHFAAAAAYGRLRNEIDSVKKSLGILTDSQEAAKHLPALQIHAGAERQYERDLPAPIRDARAQFANTSRKLAEEQQSGDPYKLAAGLRKQADDLSQKIHAAGYDPHLTYSGWHIGGHPISIEDAANLLHGIGAHGAGFVSHNPRMHGRFAFFQPSSRRPTLPIGSRTGHALTHGYADSSWDAMTHDIVGAFGSTEQARHFDRTVQLHGYQKFTGPDAYRNADAAARELNAHPKNAALDLMPVRLTPLHEAPPALWDRIESMGQGLGTGPDHAAYADAKTLFDEAQKDGPGAVTLMPKKVFNEWQSLATGSAGKLEGLKPLQGFTQGFKHTVLPFSTRWFAGNHVEAGLRSLFYGHGPVDWWTNHRAMNALQEYDRAHGTDTYRVFRAHAFGGRLYGSHKINTLHRTLDDMKDSRLYQPLRVAAPVARAALAPIRPLQEGIFRLNDFMERQATAAALGAKFRKEIHETMGPLIKSITISDKMLHDYIDHHLVDENKMAEFARYADDALGRYSKHSPAERAVIQTFMPFWDWYRNSLKFVLHTLPAHHPIKTALIVATQQAIQKEMDQQGQHYGSNLPPWLLGSVKHGTHGDRIDLAHFTPFGAFQDPVATAGDLFAPQYMDYVKNAVGKNWKWSDLKGGGKEPGGAVRGISMLNTLLQNQVPGYGLAQRAAEHAGTPYDDSTALTPRTKPDSAVKGFEIPKKLLNPFYPKTPGGKTHGSPLSSQYGVGRSGSTLKKQYGLSGNAAALRKQYGVGGGP